MFKDDNISILFCSYNGEKYIREQLDSIIEQTYRNWTLYISDDGSTDNTLNIINEYREKLPENKLVLLDGPQKGFAANFLSLMKKPDIQSSYYAFSDQDDIWLKTKLERAVNAIKDIEKSYNSQCILYGGRTRLINEKKEVIGHSSIFNCDLTLENALLQSFSGGNTMLFNDVLKKKIELLPEDISIVSHDWYLYIICSAFCGINIYDPEPQILYRQHSSNLVGSNLGLLSKIERFRRLYQGQFAEWNFINKQSLDFYYQEFPPAQQEVINYFYSCGSSNILRRIKGFKSAKVYRQSGFETFLFFLINIFNKLV
ncbi:glycosyltransferase family 2 protein [Erwinia endophytica]|uniref:glycosyltransferase family 2 protein n=1 Tax=Erwinia endophytica TaxID=1563158 RepID=UPI001265DDE9|nr:glycosyltransferase family 2 protein [Erwinia endophytica]KAB8307361.1 glycosyltransferase family 2 protein [Erwinia endophytica]